MRRVALQVLQRDVRSFVEAANAGETVLVTDRNQVVAELVPPRPAGLRQARRSPRIASDDEFVRLGVLEGWLSPATEKGPPPLPTQPAELTLEEVLGDLERDRANR